MESLNPIETIAKAIEKAIVKPEINDIGDSKIIDSPAVNNTEKPKTVKYEFKTKPFAHQIETLKFLYPKDKAAVLSEMGTGKSKIIVDLACGLYENGKINTVIIVCPNTVRGVWANQWSGQIVTHTPDRFSLYIVNTKPIHKEIDQELLDCKELLWIIVNYEQFRSEENCNALDILMRCRPTMLVLDESTSIKNPSAKQTKGLQKIKESANRRYFMTGTPIARDPLDFFSQFEFLDKNIIGVENMSQMQYNYVDYAYTWGRVSVAKSFKNLDALQKKIDPWCIRHLKKDCMDIPDKQYICIPVQLSDEQVKHYLQMQKYGIATIKDFETNNPHISSAPIVITQMLRLQQICSGYLPTEDKLFCFEQNPKLEFVRDIVKEKTKTIVFCHFRKEIEFVRNMCKQESIECVTISGEVNEKDRTLAEENFQRGTAKVIACQTETGGLGITLTAADTVIYFSNTFSFKDRAQSEDRAHRAGQTKQVTYYDLVSTIGDKEETIDQYIIEAIQKKSEISSYLLANIKGILK